MAKRGFFGSMIKPSLKFGLIGAIIVLTYTEILSRSEIIFSGNLGAYLGYLAIIIMPICTYLAIREFAHKFTDKKPKLHNAILVGLATSIIASILFSCGNLLLNSVFSPSFQNSLIQKTTESMTENGNSAEEIELRIAAIRAHYASWKPLINNLIWYVGLGFIYSIGSFLILKLSHSLNKKV